MFDDEDISRGVVPDYSDYSDMVFDETKLENGIVPNFSQYEGIAAEGKVKFSST